MGLTDKIKKAASDYKENKAKQQAEEEDRKDKILAGNIAPLKVTVNLEQGEEAYLQLPAKRMAIVERVEEHTTGKSKRKGVVGRAVVGGVLLGPLGALGGAATAGSKHTSKTVQKTVTNLENVDNGWLLFTNKRIMFFGQTVSSLPYSSVIATEFAFNKLAFKHAEMLPSEHYIVSGPNAEYGELYYRGITSHLLT